MQERSCWACGGPASPVARFAPYAFLECGACGLAFRPEGAASIQEVYASGDYGERYDAVYMSEAAHADREREAALRLAYATDGRPPGGRLLDVGAGSGVFVAAARRAGWDAEGVEPDPGFVEHARRSTGVALRHGTVEDAEYPPRSFDVVTLWHVLEHIVEPAVQLRRIAELLADGGRLALEVPNAGSAAARAQGAQWGHADLAVHVSQFTPVALGRLLEAAGLRVQRITTAPVSRYYEPRQMLTPGHLAHVAKWRWRAGGPGELLLASATPRR